MMILQIHMAFVLAGKKHDVFVSFYVLAGKYRNLVLIWKPCLLQWLNRHLLDSACITHRGLSCRVLLNQKS